ncbi:MAG: FtsX-like permease family protein [candidate division Zixibacteria bacterium]|nr:FtsX-like permease family protein [candidate division Zixibacteria bacterium]
MFANYIKIALRNITRNKIFSLINIAGLAVGMAVCILILLWVQDELSFDRFHKNSGQLYRVVMDLQYPTGHLKISSTAVPLGPGLVEGYPEIEGFVRVDMDRNASIKYGEKNISIKNLVFADPSIFELFSFPLLHGNPDKVLAEKSAAVITQDLSIRCFGNGDPIGEVISINEEDFIVMGVLENIPHNSHLQFDCLLPFHAKVDLSGPAINNWGQCSYYTYVLLSPNASFTELNQKISDFRIKHLPSSIGTLSLQPITGIHLYNDYEDWLGGQGDIKYVYMFSALALLILIIACANFTNLSTAHAGIRAKEIGVRKVIGGRRTDLIKQFLGESIIISFISLVVALVLVEAFLPLFNYWSSKSLEIDYFNNTDIIIGLISITLFTGIISGSYPAIYLSSLRPEKILKGVGLTGLKSSTFRKILVVVQFSLSILLIFSTIMIHKQLKYISNAELGFNKDCLLYMQVDKELMDKSEAFKDKLNQNSNIIGVSEGFPPISPNFATHIVDWEGKEEDTEVEMHGLLVSYDYVELLNMEVIMGRSFSRDHPSDQDNAYIINESAAGLMGLESPIGKRFAIWGNDGTIIGIVKDFHCGSLREKINPIILTMNQSAHPPRCRYICIRIKSENISNTIGYIGDGWKDIFPGIPFKYNFLDETIDNFYKVEMRIEKLFISFTFLAVFLSCLGLFGLASFMTEQRTKEICIRKILGAPVSDIIIMLTKEYSKWVLLANVIAWPIAYYFINKWLQNFAYHADISFWIFVISGTLALGMAIITVSFQAIKAAVANPVESLRYE